MSKKYKYDEPLGGVLKVLCTDCDLPPSEAVYVLELAKMIIMQVVNGPKVNEMLREWGRKSKRKAAHASKAAFGGGDHPQQ